MTIIELLDQRNEAHVAQLYPLLQQLSSSVTPDSIPQALAHPGTLIFIARQDETVVGTGSLAWSACLTGVRVHIEDVVISDHFRRQGIASLLMSAMIEHAQQHLHAKSIDLTSRPDRVAANTLYRKLGFVQRDTNVYRYSPS
ncbi:acyl-CoA N-acyltransferase [Gongronella butleri]|nr:acyl-CoA N-acyltransferase [Gongronella butleri]